MSDSACFGYAPVRLIRWANLIMALLVVALGLLQTQWSYQDYRRAERAKVADRVAVQAFRVTVAVARERGWTAVALGALPGSLPQVSARIEKARRATDRAWQGYREALQGLPEGRPALKRSRRQVAEAHRRFRQGRGRVDRQSEKAATAARLAPWFGAATGLNRALLLMGQAAERSVETPAEIAFLAAVRDRTLTVAEYAGRERGLLAYYIAASRPLPPDIRTRLQGYRGIVGAGLHWLEDLPTPRLQKTVDELRERYFRDFREIRNQAYAAGHSGDYRVTGPEWMRRATEALDTVLRVSRETTRSLRAELRAQAQAAWHRLLLSGVILLAALLWTGWGVWGVFSASRTLVRQREAASAELRRTEEEVHDLVYFDPLTGLANRFLFQRFLKEVGEGPCQEEEAAVVLVDLRQLARVNESLGPRVGDQVLQEVAALLRSEAGPGERAGHFGGGRFALLVDCVVSHDHLIERVGHLQEHLSQDLHVAGYEIPVGVNLGISLIRLGESNADVAVARAETALSRAKQGGPGDYAFFTPAMNEEAVRRLGLESALKKALDREEFRVFFQPQVNPATGAMVGVEALLRWERPGHGLVSPAEFIPILEDTGLIVEVGDWVMRTACRQNREWSRQGYSLKMAVNLSLRQFREARLVERVAEILQAYAPESRYSFCELEITESLLMEDVPRTEGMLEQLQDLGVGLALDDFGTGYSSLTHLHRFPVQTLKIDRSFVTGMVADPSHYHLVWTVVSLARAMGLETVGEGVETPAEARALAEMGCRSAQGFGFAPPMPAGEIERILSSGGELEVPRP
jgi:diguanylate cyclase (GGDEF)-like protein